MSLRAAFSQGLALCLALPWALHGDPPVFPAGTDLYFGLVPNAASPTAAGLAPIDMNAVIVRGRAANLVGLADSASSGRVGEKDIAERPLLRPGELLEAVPGLLITQHSGDGKANQYFTRGFNLDHGADFAFSVDGVPVNEPSNAHGQGYSDLNFLIPELVKTVTYTKGPFDVEVGDFATAGSANISYADKMDRFISELSMGEFGYQRALAAFPMALLGGDVYYALEVAAYDGPWQVAEGFKKYNGVLHYSRGPADDHWAFSASVYQAAWTATNQVPGDAISQGLINAFGSLSPSDGGDRSRAFVTAAWTGRSLDGEADARIYAGTSHLDLWNDFTFQLPYQATGPALDQGLAQDQFAAPSATGGEQFLQAESRSRVGATLRYKFQGRLGPFPTQNEIGLDLRQDDLLAGLYNTDQRVTYETDSLDHVVESSGAPYVYNRIDWTPWLRTMLGFRQDFFAFQVDNRTPAIQDGVDLTTATSPAGPNNELAPLAAFDQGAGVGTTAQYTATLPEPKAAVIVRPGQGPLELYLNLGQGFHSNDARGLKPGLDPLAQATSQELGLRYAAGDAYETTLSAWRMDLSSEITFNGDSAASVLHGASTRQGLEWSNTVRIRPFYVDLDAALSQARFQSTDATDNPLHPGTWVPEAIDQVGTLTVGADALAGWSLDARLRYFGSRALTADNTVRSAPSTLLSLQLQRHLWAGQSVTLSVFNALDQAVDDVDYYYAFAYPGVAGGLAHQAVVGHVTEPRSLRVTWTDSL